MYVYICMYVCIYIIYMCYTILLITACALNELLSEPPPNLVALVRLYSGSINPILRLY